MKATHCLLAAAVLGSFLAAHAADCNGNDQEDAVDIAAGTSPDCNGNGIPDECDLVSIFALGPAESLPVDSVQSWPESLVAADLNRDGDIDLAMPLPDTESIRVLLNNGAAAFPEVRDIPIADSGRRVGPTMIATDLDGDGDCDLAVHAVTAPCSGPDCRFYVSVALNQGDLVFSRAGDIEVDQPPVFMRPADFDADGDTDLAIAAPGGDHISVLMNSGAGSFAAPVSYMLDPDLVFAIAFLVIADFDGDGDIDLLAGAIPSGVTTSGRFFLLRNDGRGTFQERTVSARNVSSSMSAAAVDWDADGDIELTCLHDTYLTGYENDGSGDLSTWFAFPAGEGAKSLIVEHVNDDGFPDYVFVNAEPVDAAYNTLRVVLNPLLPEEFVFPVGKTPIAVAAADLNGDGLLDFATCNAGSKDISILLNATPVPSLDVNANRVPDECEPDCNGNAVPDDWDISSGTSTDCNRNGIPDECESDCNGNAVPDDWDISSGTSTDCDQNGIPDECDLSGGMSQDCNGNGLPDECDLRPTFLLAPAERVPAAVGAANLAVADMDGDGHSDLVVANVEANSLSLARNKGDGTFADAVTFFAGRAAVRWVLSADFDGDGDSDLAASEVGLTVFILRNAGDGTMGAPEILGVPAALTWAEAAAAEDFDNDGSIDFAVAYGLFFVAVVWNEGDGTFSTSPTTLTIGHWPNRLAAADLNNDGATDLVCSTYCDVEGSCNCLSILLNAGERGFEDAMRIDVEGLWGAFGVAASDLDGDGDIDLAGTGASRTTPSGDFAWFLFNAGDGTFGPAVKYHLGWQSQAIAAGDMEGDGDIDLAICGGGWFWNSVWVLPNNGSGTFAPALSFTVENGPVAVSMADLDQNGLPDLAVANHQGGSVSVLLNRSLAPFSPDCNGNGIPDECDIASGEAADDNGDGVPDGCQDLGRVFRRGDANASGDLDIADAIFLLGYLFAQDAAPACLDAADANDSGAIDIADAIAVLSHLFAQAGPLPEPFGACRVDPTADDLECSAFAPCEG